MARKTLAERRSAALEEVRAAKERLAKIEADSAARIARLAIKSGLVDLELTDEQLSAEFDAMASKFRGGGKVSGRSRTGEAGEG